MRLGGQIPAMVTAVTVLFWLLSDAEGVRAAVWEALVLCGRSVIPALFPFLAVSSLLTALGFGALLSWPLSPLMALYGVDGAGSEALALGLLGGYPAGARTAAALFQAGRLSREEARRVLTFSNNANPAFLITVLGVGCFGSVRTGMWLWVIHVASALLSGWLLCRGRRRGRVSVPPPLMAVHLPGALVDSVRGAAAATGNVCAFVVFFYVLVLPLRRLDGLFATAALGALELFSAAPRIPPTPAGFVLAAGLAGWGGLCVHCQTLSVLQESGLPARACLAGKALQGLLSTGLAALLQGYVF